MPDHEDQAGSGTGKKLLVLDLDETLLHSRLEPIDRRADLSLVGYHTYLRTHVSEFVGSCRRLFDLAVWTAATNDYASDAVKALFGEQEALAFVWARDRCSQRFDLESGERHWHKDLKKVKRLGYDLEQVIVVDDSALSYARHYGNLVQVRPFRGDPEDDELLALIDYLAFLASVPSVRSLEKRSWRDR